LPRASWTYVVDLWRTSLKIPVEQIAEDYLHEYARTRMLTIGTITIDAEAVPVFGSSMEYVNVTDAQCRVQRFGPGEFTLTPTGTWSPSATSEYPMGWKLSIPRERIELRVTPAVLDQDILVPGLDHYYEGESIITGFANGPVTGQGVRA